MPMPMPSGAVAVKSFRGELLQSMNESWVQSDDGSNYDEAVSLLSQAFHVS